MTHPASKIAVVMTLLVVLGFSQTIASGQSPDDFVLSESQTYFQAEALFLRRDNSLRNQPVVIDDATLGTRLSTGSLSGDIGVG